MGKKRDVTDCLVRLKAFESEVRMWDYGTTSPRAMCEELQVGTSSKKSPRRASGSKSCLGIRILVMKDFISFSASLETDTWPWIRTSIDE